MYLICTTAWRNVIYRTSTYNVLSSYPTLFLLKHMWIVQVIYCITKSTLSKSQHPLTEHREMPTVLPCHHRDFLWINNAANSHCFYSWHTCPKLPRFVWPYRFSPAAVDVVFGTEHKIRPLLRQTDPINIFTAGVSWWCNSSAVWVVVPLPVRDDPFKDWVCVWTCADERCTCKLESNSVPIYCMCEQKRLKHPNKLIYGNYLKIIN